MRRFLIAAVLLAACSATPTKSEKSADQRALDELDVAYDDHIASTALPLKANAADIKAPLEKKTEGIQVLERSYTDFASSDDPAVAAHALHRLGQLYLNLGCEIATFELNGAHDLATQTALQNALTERADPFVSRARQAFHAASKLDGGEHARAAVGVVEAMGGDADLTKVCAMTAAQWEAPRRPEVAEMPREAPDCMGLVERMATEPRCIAVFTEACASGDGRGCLGLGLGQAKRGKLDDAARNLDLACEKSELCEATLTVSAPSRRADYVAGCDDGDAIACLKLARLLDSEPPAFATQCSVSQAFDAEGDRCTGGKPNAAACWVRAGELVSKSAIEFPSRKGILMAIGSGGLGTLVKDRDETRAQRKARLQGQCNDGHMWSCVQAGKLMSEDGEDQTPVLRTACEYNDSGCLHLAEHLLLSKEKDRQTEGVELLVAGCARGHGASCQVAAEKFAVGEVVPKSPGCAAALAWQKCKPGESWECRDINRAFGHK